MSDNLKNLRHKKQPRSQGFLSFSLFLFDIYNDEEGPGIRWSITQADLLNDFPNLCTFSQKKKNITQRNFRKRNQKTAKSR